MNSESGRAQVGSATDVSGYKRGMGAEHAQNLTIAQLLAASAHMGFGASELSTTSHNHGGGWGDRSSSTETFVGDGGVSSALGAFVVTVVYITATTTKR